MSKTQIRYFEEDDILHLAISGDKETDSFELNPNITAELSEKGELIGIEILNASDFLRNSALESVQVKLMNLSFKKAS